MLDYTRDGEQVIVFDVRRCGRLSEIDDALPIRYQVSAKHEETREI